MRVADQGLELDVGLEEQARLRVRAAVGDVGRRRPRRDRDERRAEPLARPVELYGLVAGAHDCGEPVTGAEPFRGQAAGEPRDPLLQRRIRETGLALDDRLGPGVPLGRVEEAEREVHASESRAAWVASDSASARSSPRPSATSSVPAKTSPDPGASAAVALGRDPLEASVQHGDRRHGRRA